MNPIRIAIADDDAGMRLVMRKIVERAEGCELVGEAQNGEEMLALYDREQPDAVILDVEMPQMDGIACAKALQDRNPLLVIIFATAHEQYMGDAFEVYAFDYLLKPFKVDRALKTLQRVRMRLQGKSDAPEPAPVPTPSPVRPAGRLMLRGREGLSFIDLSTLLIVQREDRMTVLYCENDQRYVTAESLSDLDERLPDDMFFRTHKSYIVNLNRIESITPNGRWTYVIKLQGTSHDALITHERFEALQKMFV